MDLPHAGADGTGTKRPVSAQLLADGILRAECNCCLDATDAMRFRPTSAAKPIRFQSSNVAGYPIASRERYERCCIKEACTQLESSERNDVRCDPQPELSETALAPITFAILIISLVAVSGLLLGTVQLRGIGLGPAGVLFAGILFGHFGASINHEIAAFAKEFGLILFVFTIGLQLGPGIVQLWKKQGVLLNSMALAIVLQGFALTLVFHLLIGIPGTTSAGLFSGSTTNTPSLGAAQQAAMMRGSDVTKIETLASAYAVAYPGGIIGIIASMLFIRRLFRIDVTNELSGLREQEEHVRESIQRCCVIVNNANLNGIPFGRIPGIDETGVRLSRVQRADEEMVHAATDRTELKQGDVIQIVGPKSGLERFTPVLGHTTDLDLMNASGEAQYRRVVVTESQALNKPLRELSLDQYFNVSVTRIIRSGLEMTARGSSRLHYGDIVHMVGDNDALDRATVFLGNSTRSLKETRFSPLFVGIGVGVALGMIPIYFPGVPFPVRLGLAGGPLVAAILLSLVDSVGTFIWYIPYSANLALRELGIILFLACAGLSAGETFFAAALSRQGIQWMAAGVAVTMIPLLTTGILARLFLKQNYLTICGVIAGSMTDPPALAFANSQADSEAASIAYAAVYPLTMILRIIAVQAIIFLIA